MQILDLRDLRISVRRLFKGVNCRANVLAISQRAAADVEGHSAAAEYSEPRRLKASARAPLWPADPVGRVAVLPHVTIVKAHRPRFVTLASFFRNKTVCTMDKPLKHNGG
jgi:hypothetical protein